MFFLAPLIGAAISAIGGLVGQALGNADRATQEDLIRRSMNEIGQIDLPTLQQLAAEQLAPSALGRVRTDPRLTETQYQGLGDLSDIVNAGGLDLQAQADLNRSTSQASRVGNAAINHIQESMSARGAGNSAAGAVLQAKAAQDASQQAHDSGMNAAAAAWQRRMDALGQRSGLAGNMRQQEYGEKSRAAEAEDAIARQNADYRTAAAKYNNQMLQDAYNNRLQRATAKANAAGNLATQQGQAADRVGALGAGLGNAAAGAVNGFGQMSQAATDRTWETQQRQLDRDAYLRGRGY